VTDVVTAGLGRRFTAAVLDGLLGAIVWGWSAMCLVIAVWGFRSSPLELREAGLLVAAIVTLGLILHAVYHVAFVGGCGQTPGRMALGVRVVRRDGGEPGYGRALVRCLGGWLALLTVGVPSLGVLFTRERRGLADWLAGTRVVKA
jgi:uncharacterized RDD family membrane protein YckC